MMCRPQMPARRNSSALTQAALLHYNDFGHSLIYVTKAEMLIEQLGQGVMEPLLLSLVRGFIFASNF